MTHSNTAITPLDDVFQFLERRIQTAFDPEGNLWVCAKDLFEALEIHWSGSKSLKNLPEKYQMVVKLTTIQGLKDTVFIHESAMYRVINRSNKPVAERLNEWMADEVIPAIRKRGYYGRMDIGHRLALQKHWLQLADKLDRCKNPFIAKALLTEFQSLSREMGVKIDDPSKFRLTSEVQRDLEGM